MLTAIEAIDVHGHYGRYERGGKEGSDEFMSGSADIVVARAGEAHIRLTVVSPLLALLPRFGGNPIAGNLEAEQVVAGADGLLQWVVIDPNRAETYRQAERLLELPKCVGIKIHPEEHGYPIAEHGRAIFEFAAARRAVILAHSSEKNSLAADYVVLANDYPEVTLIIAHLGCGWDGDLTHQVRAIQQNRCGNLYTDTSSAKSITPRLIEWGVREVGAERILFGTDTPLYFTAMQRARIDHAELTDREKRLILHENAERLLGLGPS